MKISKLIRKKMASILLLPLLILCGGLTSCVEAFPSHRHRGKLSMPNQIFQGHGFGAQTKYLQQSSSNEIMSTASGALSAAVAAQPLVKQLLEWWANDLPTAKVNFPFLGNYVSRPLLENRIRQVYNSRLRLGRDAYTVVVGSKGAGKSFATAHVLQRKPGVLYLSVSKADTPSSLLRKILKISGKHVEESNELGLEILYPA